MGSCRDLHSALCRSRYISWCVETPVNTSQAAPEVTGPTGSGSVPLLLLSPPETNTAFSHQRGRSQKTHLKVQSSSSSSASHHTDPASGSSEENEHDDTQEGKKQNLRPPETSSRSSQEPSALPPGSKDFHLPRSSPVVSRRHRPVSWHGAGTDASEPSEDSSPQHLCGCSTAGSLEELESKPNSGLRPSATQADKKQRALSSSNGLLASLLHLRFSGLPARPEEHRGREAADVSTSTQERRCSENPARPADVFRSSCELDQENAHFVVVDMVLEVLEGVKWNLTPTTDADLQTGLRPSGAEEEPERQPKTFSVLSTDSGFEDCAGDTLTPKARVTDAESLAQQLVVHFRRSWLPSWGPRRGRLSLRSSLQELPGSGNVALSSSLTDEIRLRSRMRGSLSWAPPRFQIIFTVQPALRRSDVVALQHFLCAGCGTKVEPKYIKKLQYCEYLGRYFCDCCHSGAEAPIPARVLSSWDFGRYPVSEFSRQLLDSIWHQPLFDLTCVGKTLYSRVKELDKFRELQDQLLCIRKLLKACRLSDRVRTEYEQLPAHLTERPHVFSMDDLLRVKKGQLAAQARALLQAAISHVETCKLCLGRGFICEFCRDRDIIFPFQTDVCTRCSVCKTCFHKHCFAGKTCPKCARIQSRKKRRVHDVTTSPATT